MLVDKSGLLETVVRGAAAVPADEQVEDLRRLVQWFWHDLSHLTTAVARGQLWWTLGQVHELRTYCQDLLRLQHDFSAPAGGHEKVHLALPPAALEGLVPTVA